MTTFTFPYSGAVRITTVATSGSGTAWTAFPDQSCMVLDLVNNTGVDLEYRRNGNGTAMPVLNGSSRFIGGIQNSNQIQVRRIDQAATPVNVYGETFSL